MGRDCLPRLWRRAEWSLISRFGAERVARSGGCQNPNKAGWKPNFLHSPGQRPGWKGLLSLSPCKGNSIEPQIVALTGRIAYSMLYTQGVALGYVLLPLQGVLLWLFKGVPLPRKAEGTRNQKNSHYFRSAHLLNLLTPYIFSCRHSLRARICRVLPLQRGGIRAFRWSCLPVHIIYRWLI